MSYTRLILVPLVVLALSTMAAADGKRPAKSESPPPVPPAQDLPIDQGLETRAVREIQAAWGSDDPVLRVNAVEAWRRTLGPAAKESILKALRDSSALVRFGALVASGELQLEGARAPALQMADDPDGSVRVAARFALHRLGDTHLSHELEKTALDPDTKVRRYTAMVLGLMHEPSATCILRVMEHDRDPGVRAEAAQALWMLGDQEGLESLVALTLSSFSDDQMVALLALATPGDRRARGHVESALTGDYQEVRLQAARAMGMLGSDAGYGVALEGAKSTDPRQLCLAAWAFGAIGRTDAQPILAVMLQDRAHADVRLSAAVAVLLIDGHRGQ